MEYIIINVRRRGEHKPRLRDIDELISEVYYELSRSETSGEEVTRMDIKEIRNKTGLSQQRFAERYGIPIGTLHHWEAGDREAPEYVMEMLQKIVALDEVRTSAYVVNEYRDSRGVGTVKMFKTEHEAVKYVTEEWDRLSPADKRSYTEDPAAYFYAGEVDVFWDDEEMEFVPEGLEARVIKDMLR